MKNKIYLFTMIGMISVSSLFGISSYASENPYPNLAEDVRMGKLYSDAKGRVVDENGEVIPEYSDISMYENGCLYDDEGNLIDGYVAGRAGQIVPYMPGPLIYDEEETETSSTEMFYEPSGVKAAPATYEANIARGVITQDDTIMGEYMTEMADDGDYFDEIVSGAWFDENGEPLADFLPFGLRDKFYNKNVGTQVQDFYFVDGVNYTIDDIRRSESQDGDLYSDVTALLIEDIEKYNDEGDTYFVGTEYFSGEYVVVKGDFDKLLNGDDVLAMGAYMGLASDDTPNFRGVYLIICNGRLVPGDTTQSVSGETESYLEEETTEVTPLGDMTYGGTVDEYGNVWILEDSDVEELMVHDVIDLTPEQRQMAINEIYARKGRKFSDPDIQAYFDSQNWYEGTIEPEDFSDSVFSQVELDNIETLSYTDTGSWEGYYYDADLDMDLTITKTDSGYTYSICNSSGEESHYGENCKALADPYGEYLMDGETFYFGKGEDGALWCTSGIGGTWGHFVKQ